MRHPVALYGGAQRLGDVLLRGHFGEAAGAIGAGERGAGQRRPGCGVSGAWDDQYTPGGGAGSTAAAEGDAWKEDPPARSVFGASDEMRALGQHHAGRLKPLRQRLKACLRGLSFWLRGSSDPSSRRPGSAAG